MTKWIGICMGDVTGVGPEVALKALSRLPNGETKFLLFGDEGLTRSLNEQLGLKLPLESYRGHEQPGRFFLLNASSERLSPGLPPGHASAANAAMDWLKAAAAACLSGQIAGVVTAPVNKESIVRAGHKFVGQTELLSGLAKTDRTAMMLLGRDDRGRWLRVALATTHVPISKLAQQVTQPAVELAIELAAQACTQLQLPRQRVVVCGLNPHAGEGGKMGMEEITTIRPAVEAARKRGIDVTGPLSADALFYYAYRGDYEAVVAMYHDQGLTPLKMVCFEHGVNWTVGLPFVRTSPDHGTAYDIAGRGVANESSMVAALELAATLVSNSERRSSS